MGASGSLVSTLCHRVKDLWDPAIWVSQTPLEALLAATWAEATERVLGLDDYLALENLVLLLIKHGANLEQEIRLAVMIDQHRLWFDRLFAGSTNKRCSRSYISFIVGLSARQVLAILRKSTIPTMDDDSDYLAQQCSDLLGPLRVLAILQCRVPRGANHMLWLLAKSDVLLLTTPDGIGPILMQCYPLRPGLSVRYAGTTGGGTITVHASWHLPATRSSNFTGWRSPIDG